MTQPGIYIASAKQLSVFIGRCEPCNRPVRVTTDLFTGDHYSAPCPDCHKFRDLQRLYGTVSKMECHGACMGAYGKTCDCACGGINHGDIWSQPGEMLADALRFYREDRARRVEAAERAAATRARQKAERQHAAWNAWAADHGDLIRELAGTNWLAHQYPNDFLADMAGMVRREEILTEPQVLRTVAILDRRREVAEQIAAENAEREAQPVVALTEVPTVKRTVVTGEIKAAWIYEGEHDTVWKVKIDCGTYQVRGTLPANLVTEALGGGSYNGNEWRNLWRVLKGRRITLSAQLMPDGKDVGQGYFKRPTKASFAVTEASQT
jgi:hypothetical protein